MIHSSDSIMVMYYCIYLFTLVVQQIVTYIHTKVVFQ